MNLSFKLSPEKIKITRSKKESMLRYYFPMALEKKSLTRALRVALLVGLILNLINNPEIFFNFSETEVNISRVMLTFLVPFLVSSYSSAISSKFKPGAISRIDALLECKNCMKADFTVQIGEEIEECPGCKSKTDWKPKQTYSSINSDNEILKSLALFARYNPQPLLRIDAESVIMGSNPASEELFDNKNLNGQKISEFLPEFAETDFSRIIHHKDVKEILIHFNNKYFNLVLRGVPMLESIHVYASNITEIFLAEKKIKMQAGEIQDSIRYARRIQQAMLPGKKLIAKLFPEHFMFYRPRNTVSGDFYWLNKVNDCKILAVADFTGHGVPGAFMSMMGISLLNEIVLREKITSPAEILDVLRKRLILSLQASGKNSYVADGMDISVIAINEKEDYLRFAGAFNPVYLFRKEEIFMLEADRMPVGEHVNDTSRFTEKKFIYSQGDRIVLSTDGYKDQFGGEKNKKMNAKKFTSMLQKNINLPMNSISGNIRNFYDEWKNNNEQIDDVLVMGIEL